MEYRAFRQGVAQLRQLLGIPADIGSNGFHRLVFLHVFQCLCIVSRQIVSERGQGEKSALTEISETYDMQTTAIVTMEEVVSYLYQREINGKVYIDDAVKAAIDAYYKNYGVRA